MISIGMRRLLILPLLALVTLFCFQIAGNFRPSLTPQVIAQPKTRATAPDTGHEKSRAAELVRRSIAADWNEVLKWLRSKPAPDANDVRKKLTEIKYKWTGVDPQALAQALKTLLDSGQDIPTGMGFAVGNHGFLADWPTMRVFLLDLLAASDPEMAIETAREILDTARSAEEYAVALRSLTRPGMGRADDTELLNRFDHLLARQDWQNSPGFFEAFDLPRFVGSSDAARLLASWEGNDKLRSMALHEFAADHPAEVIGAFQGSSDLPADLMARADPADPEQLAAVDAYLHDPSLTKEEVASFLNAFPLRSATTGYRLYGKTPTPYTFDHITAGDRKAAELAEAWANDSTLSAYQKEINELRNRLSMWMESAR